MTRLVRDEKDYRAFELNSALLLLGAVRPLAWLGGLLVIARFSKTLLKSLDTLAEAPAKIRKPLAAKEQKRDARDDRNLHRSKISHDIFPE